MSEFFFFFFSLFTFYQSKPLLFKEDLHGNENETKSPFVSINVKLFVLKFVKAKKFLSIIFAVI